ERRELRGARTHGRQVEHRLFLPHRWTAQGHYRAPPLREGRRAPAYFGGGNACAATAPADGGGPARIQRRPPAGGPRARAEARADTRKITPCKALVAARGEAIAPRPSRLSAAQRRRGRSARASRPRCR